MTRVDVLEKDAGEPAAANGSSRRRGASLAELRSITGHFRGITLLAVLAALWWAKPFIIPIVFSLLISYALEPIVARLESWRLPRVVGAPVVLAALTMLAGLSIYGLRTEASQFIQRLPDGVHTIAQAIRASNRTTNGIAATMRQATRELDSAASAATPQSDKRVTAVRIEEPAFKWSDLLWQSSRGAIELGIELFAVFCLVYYMLVSGDTYKRKLVRIAGPSLAPRKLTVQILADINRQIQGFLWARALVSMVVGCAIWLAFRVMGMENAGVWGVLAAVLFTIPFAGPAVLIVCAGLAAFVQFDSVTAGLTVVGVSLAIATVEGNFIAPWLMGRAGRMSTLTVFVSLMFWGWIWGIWGLLLAVPLTGSIKTICEHVEGLQGVAELFEE
jgi:predicted PurR-regulated permease PerM